jgi:predicted transcriptional regulator YdeE
MIEIIKTYKQNIAPFRFVGKKYDNADRTTGSFDVKGKWGEWFENGWFDTIKKNINGTLSDIYEDGDAYIGLLRNKGGEHQYYIGIFTPENTEAPEGYGYLDFPQSELGVCRVSGKKEQISMNATTVIFDKCNKHLKENGMDHIHDKDDTCWTFERYACSCFTTPDNKENIMLDICFFLSFNN